MARTTLRKKAKTNKRSQSHIQEIFYLYDVKTRKNIPVLSSSEIKSLVSVKGKEVSNWKLDIQEYLDNAIVRHRIIDHRQSRINKFLNSLQSN
jgi:hypothetical protein